MRYATRGSGLLEVFLAKKRAQKALGLAEGINQGRVLDIGCGNYPLFLVSSKFEVKIGIDKSLDKNLINKLSRKNMQLRNFDFKDRLPFRKIFFDLVTMLAVFEHLTKGKRLSLLKEVYRVLKPEGMFVMTTPSSVAEKFLPFLARLGLVSKIEIGEHQESFNFAEIIEMLTSVGFDRAKIKHGYFEFFANRWLSAQK